jgi:hypothetical protein
MGEGLRCRAPGGTASRRIPGARKPACAHTASCQQDVHDAPPVRRVVRLTARSSYRRLVARGEEAIELLPVLGQ